MTSRICCLTVLAALPLFCAAKADKDPNPHFQTSDRCLACHNGLITKSGQDVSIGYAWRSSIMANSSRDPYWQASLRREALDHPQHQSHVEDECSICHMPITRYEAKLKEQPGEVFSHLPFSSGGTDDKGAADGVSCSVCHQITAENLGQRTSFNGGFIVNPPDSTGARPEYGPFDIDKGQLRIMKTSTEGYQPHQNSDHIRKSELCATCHTLITTAFAPDGKAVGELPEQMPYKEWLNSDYRTTQTCQDCHMPAVTEPAPITRVFGVPREGIKRHTFVAANFFMQRMLNRYRDGLDVEALPAELESASVNTVTFLKDKTARVTIENVRTASGQLDAEVLVENLSGHKFPTAFPSRRGWLHVTVRDRDGRAIFESGALRPDGSITGNDNDADPHKFEPHYTRITSPEQVEIYEDILGDPAGNVTTGLLAANRYLKDNRILPHGFDKNTPDHEIAVIGDALADPNFTGAGSRILYSVPLAGAAGPFHIEAELWYQPIGYRWANNLKSYTAAPEPKRFTTYFDSMTEGSAVLVAKAAAAQN